MQHKKLNFKDISQQNILYYDEELEEACLNICKSLRIHNMPAYDSRHYYELQDGNFSKKEIDESVSLLTENPVFDEGLLKKFKSHRDSVLFVFKGEVLSGIVHFSDYNQTKVLQAIQDDVLTFERRMRQYLFLKSYRNEDMINFFHYRAEKYDHTKEFYSKKIGILEKRADEMNQLGEFQVFDLRDLLEFGNSSYTDKLFPSETIEVNGKKIDQIRLVTSLRNMAMHGKNPVEKDEETSVYSIESLRYLFTALKTLEDFTYHIEKLISSQEDYRKSLVMDNRSKLEIIHEHHPQALNYFIGD
ncbi:hypothetical protein [Salinimicrobium sp. TH3]|uniref:hypothetical protein n=1 Tax=Salinimicrobium sp. TH3 TaxID=2997342 RepID=UPI002274FB3D|nr:hypothetical protein [Salinimicrobium sp. TH3]MCY2687629.1 hypothetical protein [Salinimicrobium sp. TH3]